jgi:hypothetical protein
VEQHPIGRATRRTVLAGVAAALAPGRLLAQAQRDGMRRLGVLFSAAATDPVNQANVAALVQ